MNWYKKAQELDLVHNEDVKGEGRHYTDIGHDAYWGGETNPLGHKNPDYMIENPNILWVYCNGDIKTKPETSGSATHFLENWGLSCDLGQTYTGRYSPSKKIITITMPTGGLLRFREIPKFLMRLLKQKFSEAEKIIQYK